VDRLVASWPAADAYASSLPLMSHWAYCVAPAALYLLSVSGLRRVMRSRVAPIDVPTWFQALHNLALVLLSAFMASALLWQALRLGYGVICNRVVEGPLGKPVRMHPHLLHVTHERKISFFFFFFFDVVFFSRLSLFSRWRMFCGSSLCPSCTSF
jgi:hypothetical protein